MNVIIKGGGERRTIRRVELVASIERKENPYGSIGRHYLYIDSLESLGFFGHFRSPIAEYVFHGDVGRKPVRRIALARNMELLPHAEEKYDLRLKLLEPGSGKSGYFWKLTAVARTCFSQNSFANAYIKPLSE